MKRNWSQSGALEPAALIAAPDERPAADEVFFPWAETMPFAELTLTDPPAPRALAVGLRGGAIRSVIDALRKVFRR